VEKRIFVADISDGDPVDAPFLVEYAELRDGRRGKYISCTLSDRTGRISCKVWGRGDDAEVQDSYAVLRGGGVFRITGYAKTYRDACEVNVNDGVKHLGAPFGADALSFEDYCEKAADDAAITAGIAEVIGTIGDPALRTLVGTVIAAADGFSVKPAAKFRHHAYRGGLAEHTLEVARVAAGFADQLCIPLRRDIVIAGALLHDIGKCPCFEEAGPAFSATPAYDLVGHITLGVQMLEQRRGTIDDGELFHLLHIIQSHHGPYGEVRPHTPEAWAVHLADLASATLREVADDVAELVPGERRKKGARSGEAVYRFPDSGDTL
jgi:3'-5' exoribonuclease